MIPVIIFVVLIVGILYPNAFTFARSFFPDGAFSIDTYIRFFSTPSAREAFTNTLLISIATVILSAAIGIPLAFFFHRYEFPGRRILRAIASVPVLLPPLVGVIAIYFLYGDSGVISRGVQLAFGLSRPWPGLHGMAAILFVHAYTMYVYFFMFVSAGLERLDSAMEEAAETLGASRYTQLTRVTLPMLIPALVGGSLVTFMSSMASFTAPYIFGGGIRVLATEILNSKLNGNVPMALVETVLLTIPSLAVLFLLRWYEGRKYIGVGKGVARQRTVITSNLAKVAATIVGFLAVVFLLLPHLMVILMSFIKDGTWTTELLPPTYTAENYVRLFRDSSFFEPIRNSLWMAALATAANLAWGLTATLWLRKRKGNLRQFADVLIILPFALPGTVVALAMVESFSTLLAGTVILLPFIYFIRNLPLVARSLDASFAQLDPAVEEASSTLGATAWYTVRRVVLPLVLPGVIAGGVLAFITALGEFVSSIVAYVYSNRPISIEILSQFRQFNLGTASAYGVLLIILIAVALFVAEGFREGTNVRRYPYLP